VPRRLGADAAARVAAGWLELAEPTVVVLAGSEDTWWRRLQVGLLALGGRGWVSHEAAACLHQLDRAIAEAVEFTVARSARRSCPSAAVHTATEIGHADLVTVGGLRCASATRTIIDLAHSDVSTVRLEAAIDSAVRLGLSSPIVLERRLAELRGPGRWGARHLDRLLIDSGGESLLERRFLQLVREAGLPRPSTQVVQRHDGRHLARVDFLFEAAGVVIEVTGRLSHSSPADRGRDAQRRHERLDLGLRTFEYTRAHVTERRAWVAETLRARLGIPCPPPQPVA